MSLFNNPFTGMKPSQIEWYIKRYEHLLAYDCNGLILKKDGSTKKGPNWSHMRASWQRSLELAKSTINEQCN